MSESASLTLTSEDLQCLATFTQVVDAGIVFTAHAKSRSGRTLSLYRDVGTTINGKIRIADGIGNTIFISREEWHVIMAKAEDGVSLER